MFLDYIRAGNPNISDGELEELSQNSDPRIRRRVAENSKSPPHILGRLCRDSEPDVRLAVAENPSVPLNILEMLVEDESEDIRFELAEDPHMPWMVLVRLARDHNPYVSHRAILTLTALGAAANEIMAILSGTM